MSAPFALTAFCPWLFIFAFFCVFAVLFLLLGHIHLSLKESFHVTIRVHESLD